MSNRRNPTLKPKFKAEVDLLVRTRKTSHIYLNQLEKVKDRVMLNRIVVVFSKDIARLLTDLAKMFPNLELFSVKVAPYYWYIIRKGACSDLTF